MKLTEDNIIKIREKAVDTAATPCKASAIKGLRRCFT